ncbi:MAG: glutamine--fructose-6-phosphate transaminase (isomerizing) [Oscillospiraceae bacterium]|nr:glutamine--fructose-6-phosphate transaminase (isomerizing) [Oscillospiraceae bacterium]
MCGIVGFAGDQNAAPILLEGLKLLEYRGYDSAGIAVMNEGKISLTKTQGKIANLCEKTQDGTTMPGLLGIGHTRWATHGAPNDTNAHPHLSNDGRFAVVHNGIIENYMALREELTAKGFVFKSETDTEVIVNLLELYYKGNLKAAVMKTASRLEGSYALGVACADYPDRLFAVREASPLIIGVGVGENHFASDVTAIIGHTRNVIYLEDGEFAELTADSVTVYDCMGNPIEPQVTRISWDIEAAEKGGYEHFMLKEIMEQPRAIKATIEPRVKDGRIVLDDFDMTEEQFKGINKILVTACGSSYYVACAAKYMIEKLCRIPVTTELASELRYSDPIIDEHTLLIVLSQSGETADTIAALKECKARGARTLAIVNVVGSTIAKLADNVLYTWAGPEIAVATTKAYTTQMAVMFMFALYAADKLGKIDAAEYDRLVGELFLLPGAVQRAIDLSSDIPELAKKYYKTRSLFFIGRNVDYAICLEGSLKMKEISYIHSEAYAAGELKHGPIALVDDKTLLIAAACYEELFEKTLSNIKEVKARGAEVLGIALEGNRAMSAEADDVLYVPRTEPMFNAIAEIIPMQLLSYYVAKENGCDIDKPKNLAKSVTVE